jgi:hypothetical protein
MPGVAWLPSDQKLHDFWFMWLLPVPQLPFLSLQYRYGSLSVTPLAMRYD